MWFCKYTTVSYVFIRYTFWQKRLVSAWRFGDFDDCIYHPNDYVSVLWPYKFNTSQQSAKIFFQYNERFVEGLAHNIIII